MNSIDAAIDRLQQGNKRFVEGVTGDNRATVRPKDVAQSQSPFAIVLGCADSRVPPEMLFDQALGDLFVIRVAGSIALPSQIGSIEFALQSFGSPLVVVLGHSQCGGVRAALSSNDQSELSNLSVVVTTIKNNLSKFSATDVVQLSEESINLAVIENVRATVSTLTNESSLIAQQLAEHKCRIVGAHYNLLSGVVEFLE